MPRITNPYERQHINNLAQYAKLIDQIFKVAAQEAAAIGVSAAKGKISTSSLFSFNDHPLAQAQIQSLLSRLAKRIETAIVNGIDAEWTLANNKNNELARRVFADNIGRLTQAQYRQYFSTNDNARQTFLERKEQGLNLSERVWRYANEFKDEMELGLDVGIRNGLDADAMSRELRQYLRHPDKLFRRVRDEHGNLVLSKRAADFHPGQGVYRSSYKNARRLAVTETNIAYRAADYERIQQFDFVVGIEVCLSNNHPIHDICDDLCGRYPKDFKFTGWHPHCRCYTKTILKTEEELMEENAAILRGEEPTKNSVNSVSDVPQVFKKWVENNQGRIERAKTMPYFLTDNPQFTGIAPMYGSNGYVTGTKLGRAATKAAFKMYDNYNPPTLTTEQVANVNEIANDIGISVSPMTFEQANKGRGNALFGKGDEYDMNCQICAVVHEARLRGLNVTAIGYDSDPNSIPYKLGESYQRAWFNAKGKVPTPTVLRDKSFDAMFAKLNNSTKAVGRYHIGINMGADGHLITAERFADGTMIYYDAQNGTFLNIEEYADRNVDYFEVLKIDKLLLNKQIFKAILRVL